MQGGPEQRADRRRRTLFTGRIVHSRDLLTVECSIQNISRSGARVKLAGAQAIGEPVYLVDMRHGLAFKTTVRWRRDDRLGLAFTDYYDLSKPNPGLPELVRRLWLDYLR